MKEMKLYVHIPFCVRKCNYCDFLSFVADKEIQERYLKALEAEIVGGSKAFMDYEVSTVFIGGGTPSLLEADGIEGILKRLKQNYFIREEAEISVEVNPGTVSEEKLKRYRESGVNRISFGCQSTLNEELKSLGRIHTFEEFMESWEFAREAGFKNINVDLISGLPGQDVNSWERSLREIASLSPEHISVYSLILEEGTPFYENQEKLNFPDEDSERMMYESTHDILAVYGYWQYEISNYSKTGYECRHNLGYWTGAEYWGIGLGSSSLIGNIRFRNTSDMKCYLENSYHPDLIQEETERLNKMDHQAEFMIFGLRLTEGVAEREFEKKFGIPLRQVYGKQIEKYWKAGLLKQERGRIFLTRRGLSLSNMVMSEFLP
ncbi:MAG: oxygen-independent coproporphyrinogen III oxidase [Lachnospiraceae bacterium]|nr:oxygen-independent coproporphyrinogen III oxidase [Lachnospiraceae bacterium]